MSISIQSFKPKDFTIQELTDLLLEYGEHKSEFQKINKDGAVYHYIGHRKDPTSVVEFIFTIPLDKIVIEYNPAIRVSFIWNWLSQINYIYYK